MTNRFSPLRQRIPEKGMRCLFKQGWQEAGSPSYINKGINYSQRGNP
jgi:hypothetical protein